MIYKKTAIFFEKAALCGALAGGADEASAEYL
jgi:geranylgeranyl pyrophosphate synthase